MQTGFAATIGVGCSCDRGLGIQVADSACSFILGETPRYLLITVPFHGGVIDDQGIYEVPYIGSCIWALLPSPTWAITASISFDGTNHHLHVNIMHVILPLSEDYDLIIGGLWDGVTLEDLTYVPGGSILPVPSGPLEWEPGG